MKLICILTSDCFEKQINFSPQCINQHDITIIRQDYSQTNRFGISVTFKAKVSVDKNYNCQAREFFMHYRRICVMLARHHY